MTNVPQRPSISSAKLFLVDSSLFLGAMGEFAASLNRGFAPAIGEAQGVATRAVALNFRTGGHGSWAPPKPTTLKRRRTKKTPPALTDTGQLKGAFASPGAPHSVNEQTTHGFVRGTDRVDARAHQLGRKRKGKIILPARPFATLSKREEEQIVGIIAAEVRQKAKKVSYGTR